MSEVLKLARKLEQEGEKFEGYLAGLRESDWQREVYTEGAVWTIRSVAAHLLSAEEAFFRLISSVKADGPGVPEDFQIDDYNADQQIIFAPLSASRILERFHQARSRMLTLISGLSDQDLEKRGRHPYLGMTTVREMIKMVYLHGQVHVREIRRVIGSVEV